MSRTIHGKSHEALKLFRDHPAALSVFWDYASRANGENVAWPSVRGLAADTGWNDKTCHKARQWLVEHGALEEVSDYTRPQWRALPPQELAQKKNFDKAKYFRPTGVLTIDSKVYDLLYVVTGEEADPLVDASGTDVVRDTTSEGADVVPDTTSVRCGTGYDVGHGTTELDSIKEELDSSEEQSPKGDTTASTAAQSTQSDPARPFAIGQVVWWQHKPRGGYGYIDLIQVKVVKYTAKRVTIEVPKKDGTTVARNVQADSLSVDKPTVTRPDDPLLDVLLHFGWNIAPSVPVADELLDKARAVKGVVLTTYPDMTGARLRQIYQDYAPYTPNKAETVMQMIGKANHEHHGSSQSTGRPGSAARNGSRPGSFTRGAGSESRGAPEAVKQWAARQQAARTAKLHGDVPAARDSGTDGGERASNGDPVRNVP